MSGWAYALVCVVVPPLWAIAVVRHLRVRDAKRAGFSAVGKPPSDYSI